MAHHIDGGMDADRDSFAPPVRFEPCAEFRVDHTAAWPVCDACGWLADDHAANAGSAVVRELPRRSAELPTRMAS
jgi:hypothetical protein